LQDSPITIFGDGEQQRSFTFVGDVVNANLFVAEHPKTAGEVYNCASGINVTVKEMALELMDKIGKDVPIVYDEPLVGDIMVFHISNKKLTDLGMVFQTNFSDGLDTTINWMKEKLKDAE
jgi:UDP-glucose 4-epimerase